MFERSKKKREIVHCSWRRIYKECHFRTDTRHQTVTCSLDELCVFVCWACKRCGHSRAWHATVSKWTVLYEHCTLHSLFLPVQFGQFDDFVIKSRSMNGREFTWNIIDGDLRQMHIAQCTKSTNDRWLRQHTFVWQMKCVYAMHVCDVWARCNSFPGHADTHKYGFASIILSKSESHIL